MILYTISLYPIINQWKNGKKNYFHVARHYTPNKKRNYSEIKLYLQGIVEEIYQNTDITIDSSEEILFKYFVGHSIYLILMERICLECRLNNTERLNQGLSKIRIKARCEPYKNDSCKMDYIATKIYDMI